MRLVLLVLAAVTIPALAELNGRVVSPDGPLEGVVVSARHAATPVMVSVVSGAEGRFSFPAAKLAPGKYALRIRATGYELDGPQAVELTNSTQPIELALKRTTDITKQLTNAEWIASFPGSEDQKKFLYGCVGCHPTDRIAQPT